jgi:hypothetical protein
MKRKSAMAVTALSALAAMGLAVVAIAQPSDKGPSEAVEVPGPSVGPSGQTGELHYLENPGTEYQGGARQFGPFRLLPPGVAFIPRPFQGEPATRLEKRSEPTFREGNELALQIPTNFTEKSASAMVVNGKEVRRIDYVFTSPEGEVSASTTPVAESSLPLDVYQYFDDSPLENVLKQFGDIFVVIEQPKTGPAPNVGYVNIYARGRLILLQSADVGQDRLLEIGLELAQR